MLEVLLGKPQGQAMVKGWSYIANSQLARRYHMSVAHEDYMYLFGGYGPTAPTYYDEFKRYNTKTNVWETLPTGPSGRCESIMVVVGDMIYLYGGNSGTRLNDFWCYDIALRTWTSLPVTGITVRSNPAGAVVGTNIYITGGDNGNYANHFQNLWRYDTVAKTWFELAPIPLASSRGCAFSIGGDFYYCQGMTSNSNYLDNTYKYVVATNTWVQVANAPYKAQKAAICVLNDIAYMFGGFNGSSYNALYSFNGTVWQSIIMPTPLAASRYGHTLVTVNDELWMFGGYLSTYSNQLARATL